VPEPRPDCERSCRTPIQIGPSRETNSPPTVKKKKEKKAEIWWCLCWGFSAAISRGLAAPVGKNEVRVVRPAWLRGPGRFDAKGNKSELSRSISGTAWEKNFARFKSHESQGGGPISRKNPEKFALGAKRKERTPIFRGFLAGRLRSSTEESGVRLYCRGRPKVGTDPFRRFALKRTEACQRNFSISDWSKAKKGTGSIPLKTRRNAFRVCTRGQRNGGRIAMSCGWRKSADHQIPKRKISWGWKGARSARPMTLLRCSRQKSQSRGLEGENQDRKRQKSSRLARKPVKRVF